MSWFREFFHRADDPPEKGERCSQGSASQYRHTRLGSWRVSPYETCVWSLLLIDSSTVACGNGDGSIRVFDLLPDRASLSRGSISAVSAKRGDIDDPDFVDPNDDDSIAQLKTILRGHSDAVHALLLIQTSMISASADGSLRLWDVCSLQCHAALLGHGHKVLCCCSPANQIASWPPKASPRAMTESIAFYSADSFGGLIRWTLTSDERVGQLHCYSPPRMAAAITARAQVDGRSSVFALAHVNDLLVTASGDHRVRLWTSDSLAAVAALDQSAHQASVFALAVIYPSADSSSMDVHLASADASGTVIIWQLSQRLVVKRLTSGEGSLCALAWRGSHCLFGTGGRGELLVWPHDEIVRPSSDKAPGPVCPAGRYQFHSSGLIALIVDAAVSERCTLRVFSAATDGTVTVHAVDYKPDWVTLAAKAPGPAASILAAHQGCVWSLASESLPTSKLHGLEQECEVDELLFTGGADGKVRIWHRTSSVEQVDMADVCHSKTISNDRWCARAELCCASDPTTFSASSRPDDQAEEYGPSTVYSLLLVRCARCELGSLLLIVGLQDGRLLLWSQSQQSANEVQSTSPFQGWICVQQCVVHRAGVLCLTSSGSAIFSGSADCAIGRLELEAGGAICMHEHDTLHKDEDRQPQPLLSCQKIEESAHEAEVHAVVVHADIMLISSSADSSIKVWSAHNLTLLYVLRPRAQAQAAKRASRMEATGMWPHAHTGAVYALLCVRRAGSPLQTSHSKHSTRLISGGADMHIKVWDLTIMEQVAALAGHRSFVCALACDTERRFLFSASSDKTCGIWHVDTYVRLGTFAGPQCGLYSISISRNGHVYTGSLDGTVRVWPLKDVENV